MHLMSSESQGEMHGGLRWFVEEALIPAASSLPHAARGPAEVVNRVAELRLFGILVPQGYGGLGLDPVSSTIAVVELARPDGPGGRRQFGCHARPCEVEVRRDRQTSV